MTDREYATSQHLGALLRERRRALGLTQDDVAELAGTTQKTLSMLETGKPTARLDKLADVAEAVGLAVTLVPREAVSHPRRTTPAEVER